MLRIRNVNDEAVYKDFNAIDRICTTANVTITAVTDTQRRKEYAMREIIRAGYKRQWISERKVIQVFLPIVNGRSVFICSIEETEI